MKTAFLFLFILFLSCNDGKNSSQPSQGLNAIKSKMMIEEIEKYLKRADEITNKEVKEFHVVFYESHKECLFEINYENNSYNLENLELNNGHINIENITIFFHGLNLPCTRDFVNIKLLNKEKITIKRYKKEYVDDSDLFQLYLITGKGKLRRLAKT